MKILVVDDNDENLYLLQVLLKGHGFEVETAVDGEDALRKAREQPPRMVISDILMPKMDGFALCRQWKQDDCLKSIPFIVYTATYTDPKDERFALGLGAERFIVKPADPDDFIREIREVLDGHQNSTAATVNTWEGEESYLRQHNEVLIRKLEDKIKALQESKQALEQEISERRWTEEQLLKSLKEKKTLLQELYHRTYNNLQVIRSLLVLQASTLKNEQVDYLVKCTENRLQAIALVHQMLHQAKDLSRIELNRYIPVLYSQLLSSFDIAPEKVALDMELETVSLLIDSAIPCGLILNELISNSLRFAFPKSKTGRIAIRLTRSLDDLITLYYQDNGVGLPSGLDLRTGGKLGFQTVFALAEQQLKGKVTIKSKPGMFVQLSFRDSLYSARV